MKRSLYQLLRVRSLLEDISRLELEAKLQELAQIESALRHSRETAREMRQRHFAGITTAQNFERLEAEVVSEWVAWQQGAFESARHRRAADVNAAKEAYLERRKESRQVEGVIEAGEAAAAIELNRREQRELDDWFGQRMISGGTISRRDRRNRPA